MVAFVRTSLDGLVVLFVSPIMIDAAAVAQAIVDETGNLKKPVLACVMGRQRSDEANQILQRAGIPVFRYPEDAAITLHLMCRRSRWLSRKPEAVEPLGAQKARVGKLLASVRSEWLPGATAEAILQAYGIPFVPSQRAHHAEWLSSEGRNPDSASFVPRRRHVPTTQPPARSRASRPRRGSAGAAFRAAERAVSTPRVVRTRSALLAALAANGADAFRVKVHVGGCACERAAAFRETCGDGMLAIPDSRGARAALRVAEAEGDTRHSLEARLKNLLFPDVPVDGVILRVSCAACLLESMPNGAVAFIADSEGEALCNMEPRKA